MSNDSPNGWTALKDLLIGRISKAIQTPSFLFTFLGVIVVTGSIGIWFPYVIKLTKTPFSPEGLFTYSITIIASVLAEIILKEEDSEGAKGFKMLLLCLSIISIICLAYDLSFNRDVTYLGSIGTIIVLLIWLVTNANDEKYDDKQSPNNPIGGNITGPTNLSGEGL